MIGVASAMPDSPTPSAPIGAPSALHDMRRPFVVVTGLSGAGRITALHALDDMGYVAVDNLPLPLLGDLMRSTAGNPGEMAAPLARSPLHQQAEPPSELCSVRLISDFAGKSVTAIATNCSIVLSPSDRAG